MVGGDFDKTIDAVRSRLMTANEKHGDWSNYTPEQVFEAVEGEFNELRDAFLSGKLVGRHGQIDESCDLAVVGIKSVRRLVDISREVMASESTDVLEVQQGPIGC